MKQSKIMSANNNQQQQQHQRVQLNQWTVDALNHVTTVLQPHNLNGQEEQQFLHQIQNIPENNYRLPATTEGNNILTVLALWALARVHSTNLPSVRHFYMQFINKLLEASVFLNKALLFHTTAQQVHTNIQRVPKLPDENDDSAKPPRPTTEDASEKIDALP